MNVEQITQCDMSLNSIHERRDADYRDDMSEPEIPFLSLQLLP